jgi:uncharacterized phiE125 gp8 family phage protein
MHRPVSVLSEPPAAQLISMDLIRRRVRREVGEDDESLELLQAAAISQLDGCDGILGRALVSQEWVDIWHGFPVGDRIPLALAPVLNVISVKYFDLQGVEQILPQEAYRLHKGKTGTFYLHLHSGMGWPATFVRDDSIKIAYSAGYGPDPTNVPATIRLAALDLVEHWYEPDQTKIVSAPRGVPAAIETKLRRFIRPHF